MKSVFSRFLIPKRPIHESGLLACFIATFLLTSFGLPGAAYAQNAVSMGDVFCNLVVSTVPFLNVIDMVAYVGGGIFIIQGIIHWKDYYDNPGQNPLYKTAALMGVGAILLVLPSAVSTLIDTLFVGGENGVTGGGISTYCVIDDTAAGYGGTVVPLDVMLTNFVNNIQGPITFLISAVAITFGLFLIVRGLMKAAKYGTDPRTHSITNISSNLIFGTALVVIGQSVDMVMLSVLGTSAEPGALTRFQDLNWTALNSLGVDTTHFQAAMQAALTFFQIVGLISFVRGWNILRNAVEGTGQATVAQGLTHIIGGVMAINIYLFMQIMDSTFGTQFVS